MELRFVDPFRTSVIILVSCMRRQNFPFAPVIFTMSDIVYHDDTSAAMTLNRNAAGQISFDANYLHCSVLFVMIIRNGLET